MKKLLKSTRLNPSLPKLDWKMKISTLVLFFCFFALQANEAFSQKDKLTLNLENITVGEVLDVIEQKTDYRFFYIIEDVQTSRKISINVKNENVIKVLEFMFKGTNNAFNTDEKQISIIKKKQPANESIQPTSEEIIQYSVSGTVVDELGTPLVGANIVEKGTDNGVQTDFDGNFSIETTTDTPVVVISYIGFLTQEIVITDQKTLNIVMQEDAAALDEVVLTGIRASQQRAVEIKRSAIGFVDAITAESAGKLPDANVAEALQRVAGVSISRTRGQGDFISIRGLGPEFARGSLNGRSLVSASTARNTIIGGGATASSGRAANFDVLPSDIIETIEVFKTSSAEHVEGGIGGSVNIKTVKPLDFGKKFGFNAKGTSFMGRNLSPSISGYGSFVNDSETFGAFFTASYSNRLISEDAVRSFQYRQSSTDAIQNQEIYYPFASIPEVIQEDRERTTFNATMQWKPSEKTNITLDGTYSKRNLDYIGYQAVIQADPGAGAIVDESTLVSTDTNTAQSFSGIFPAFFSTDSQQGEDNILSLGLNLEQDLGNNWSGIFDASLSSTRTVFGFQRGALRPPANQGTPFDLFIEDNIVFVEPTDNTDFSDLSRLESRGQRLEETDITDREFATRLDIKKDINSDFFSKFKTGIRFRSRKRETMEALFNGFVTDADGNRVILTGDGAEQAGVSMVTGADISDGDFLNGEWTPGLYENFIWIENTEQWREAHEAQGAIYNLSPNLNNSFDVSEKTFAWYGQLDVDGMLGDFPITGNIGVRLVNTDLTVEGTTQEIELVVQDPNVPNPVTNLVFTDNVVPINRNSNYLSFLPSVNLKIQANENTYFRAAYSKTITRPQFLDLGGYSINATNRIVNSAGNADLDPYESDNFDIGMEWYTGGTGAIGISFFYKDLSSFVTDVTFQNFQDLGVEWDSYTTIANQGEGSIAGTEISIQQPLKFLPKPLNGLGIIANFTFTHGQQSLIDGTPIPFEGVSDFSFNSALYYDKGGKFQGRLAYTFRDDFLITASDVFNQELYNDGYGQLDAAVNYKLTKNLTIYGEAINLTNSANILYSSNSANPAFNNDRPTGYELTGTRWSFGIRGSF